MRSKMKAGVLKYLVSLVMMLAIVTSNAGLVYAGEYYDLNGLADNTAFVLGDTVEFSITPRKHVASKWTDWSNYPNYVYVEIYKDAGTEPCEDFTFIYNRDGKSVGTVSNFMMPKAVGVARTVSYTPDAAGTYTVKIFWQSYDEKYYKEDPALKDQLTFTVKTASGSSGTGASAGDGSAAEDVVTDLPAVRIVKPQAAGKAAVVRWKKAGSKIIKKIGGIEIQYSQDKSFSTGVKVKTAKKSALSKKITGLKQKKNYYFRIRTYKMVKGVKHVSKWSAIKTVKVK